MTLSDRMVDQAARTTEDLERATTMSSSPPLSCLPPNGRFDLMLAAETTYTPEAAKNTAVLMARHLKIETGIGLVATKRYYFGVGGGVDSFRQAADSLKVDAGPGKLGKLVVDNVKVYDNGKGNIREILQVKCVLE